MKKIVITSILINILLLGGVVVLLNKYSKIKNKCNIDQKETISIEKNKNNDSIFDKTDPIYIYNSKKFACDEGTGSSYGYNLCSGERLYFADSLLRETVKYKLKEFDDFIKRYKEGVLKAKGNSYFVNCLRMSVESKENFIKSQKVWEEMRVLNSEEIGIYCDGVPTCVGNTNSGEIKFILERIEKIKVGDPCF